MSNIREKLTKLQNELKAPKGQFNSFGKYKYRSAEDIVEAVKPLLLSHQLTMTITDEIKMIGDRYYIEATVTLFDWENDSISVKGFAREEASKKGMDGSQVTGASSSYARKYALNGMFAIDDTKDSDATNTGESKTDTKKTTKQTKSFTNEQIAITKLFNDLITEFGSNTIVYENIALTKEQFKEQFNNQPEKLWEYMQQFA